VYINWVIIKNNKIYNKL
jgi:hypothetical protein